MSEQVYIPPTIHNANTPEEVSQAFEDDFAKGRCGMFMDVWEGKCVSYNPEDLDNGFVPPLDELEKEQNASDESDNNEAEDDTPVVILATLSNQNQPSRKRWMKPSLRTLLPKNLEPNPYVPLNPSEVLYELSSHDGATKIYYTRSDIANGLDPYESLSRAAFIQKQFEAKPLP
jgi:hypothetical protein